MKHFSVFGKRVFSWGEEVKESKVKNPMNSKLYGLVDYNLQEIDLVMCRKVALSDPFFMKGCTKKNMDVLRNWFEIKSVDGKKVDSTDEKTLYDFESRTNFKNKLFVAGECSNIYGTGFLELIFKSEVGRVVDVSSKPDEDDEIVNVNVINPEFIIKREQQKVKDKTVYWIYKETIGQEKPVHPDRLIPVITDKLPFSDFGISKVRILNNILKSKLNADMAAGEMLAWSSTGILDMTIEDMDDEGERAMIDVFKKHPSAYVHDQAHTLQVLNPNRIDPKPYYDYLVSNIAAAFNMPVHIMVGLQAGDVSGSEIGFSDYVHDCENIQQNTFTPIIEYIYKNIIESRGKRWRYFLDWDQVFVDELSEAKILQTRTYSVTQCYDRGIIDTGEARNMLNEGTIHLDPDKPMESKQVETPSGTDPNVEPMPSVKKPTVRQNDIFVPYLTDEQKKLIENLRRLGEQELVEQERRIREAEEKKKGKQVL